MNRLIRLFVGISFFFITACQTGEEKPLSNFPSLIPPKNFNHTFSEIPKGIASHLPKIEITTENRSPIVSKEEYVNGYFEIADENGVSVAKGRLDIRGRGNSSWGWPKKPFRIKLEKPTEILGMPASKHWVLLANYIDKSLIRNDAVFELGRAMEMEYTVKHRHVELILNGEYRGIYQLTEQIRIEKNRLDIHKLTHNDIQLPETSGGYLIEVDFRMRKNYCENESTQENNVFCNGNINTEREKTLCIESQKHMQPFCLKEPNDLFSTEKTAQRRYIRKYIQDTEVALFSSEFSNKEKGYTAYIDVKSAIDYYLINEFVKNVDAGTTSFFMYKKRGGKLFFGPIWDFDLSMGNNGESTIIDPRGWHLRKTPWFNRLFKDPAFEASVIARWNDLKERGVFEHFFQYMKARAHWLSLKQNDNFNLWSRVWSECSHFTRLQVDSYEAEIDELILWQRARYEWMDGVLNGTLDPTYTPITTRCTPNDYDWTDPFQPN